MFLESGAESYIEGQVEKAFDEIALSSKKDRKLIRYMAAMSLMELINEERLATQEWMTFCELQGVDDRNSPPKGPSAYGTALLGRFEPADQPEGEVRLIDVPVELSDDPDRLQIARQNLAEAIILLPDAYGLSYREVLGVEAKARCLEYPKFL